MAVRLGGPLFAAWDDPESWARAVRAAGYTAAFCPLDPSADDATVRAYADAAARHNVMIAEVGAWSNPISPDNVTRHAAIEQCQRSLDLADRIGACCCVNVAGSRHPTQFDGAHEANLTDETFALIVETVRKIIDAVQPTRSHYALEASPFLQPDSADGFERILKAVKRDRLAVHFDPVDLINSPKRFYTNGRLIKEFVASLGPHIKACHARDVVLHPHPLVHLDEVPPGRGGLDYGVYLKALNRLGGEMPLLLERLPEPGDYAPAAAWLRETATQNRITIE